MPLAKANKAYKFARPFDDPYRVVKIYEGEGQGAEVRPVDQPTSEAIRTICAVVLTRFLLPLYTGSRDEEEAILERTGRHQSRDRLTQGWGNVIT